MIPHRAQPTLPRLAWRRVALIVCVLFVLPFVLSLPAHARTTADAPAAVDAHPATVRAGLKTNISGRGFAPGEPVQISFDGIPQRTATATRYGGFGGQTIVISLNVLPGTHSLTAVGLSSHRTASSTIRVLEPYPGVDAHPATVRAGLKTNISGRGFAPGEPVQISFDGIPQRTATATGYGAFGGQTIVISLNVLPGTYRLTATGLNSHRTASSTIRVLEPYPGVDAHPATVRAGLKTNISGRGFAPGEPVQISFDGILQRTATAGRYGDFGGQTLVISLNVLPGTHTLSVVGLSSHRTASSTITVLEPYPGVDAHPATVRAGQLTNISGRGFAPGEPVQISFDGILQRTATATRFGAFGGQTILIAPNVLPGTHTLSAVGLSSHRTASSTITVTQ